MKILCVCKKNVWRSQIAEAFFRKYSDFEVISAGFKVEDEQWKLIDEYPDTPQCMLDIWINIWWNKRKQLTKKMCDRADKIIFIADVNLLPDYIDKNKLIVWNIGDGAGMDYVFHCKMRDDIQKLVLDFLKKK